MREASKPTTNRGIRPRPEWWTWVKGGTSSWNLRLRVRRVEVGFHVYKHTYPRSSDRWVFHPFVVYDRAPSGVAGSLTKRRVGASDARAEGA